jgi:hypothetical protein
MEIKRYVMTQAVITDYNTLIPIWDDEIVFEKTEMYGNVITLKGGFISGHCQIVECIYDLKTKQLEAGIEIGLYPADEDLEFKKGDVVFFEKSYRHLTEAVISEIVYEEFDLVINRGKNIDMWFVKRLKGIEIDANSLYAIKQWKPFYLLDNGIKIEYAHQLYHKAI